MAMDFPNSPSINDTYTASGRTWVWNGVTWTVVAPLGPTGPTGPTGPAVSVSDEGTPLTTAVVSVDFVGAGVTVTEPTVDNILVTVPGEGPFVVELMASDFTTSLTAGDGKAGFMIPAKLNGWNLVRADAGLLAAQSSSGAVQVQIRNATQAADMLTTPITIDANESTSHTAATEVVDVANDDVATGDLIMVDIDSAGTGAKGLICVLEFELP